MSSGSIPTGHDVERRVGHSTPTPAEAADAIEPLAEDMCDNAADDRMLRELRVLIDHARATAAPACAVTGGTCDPSYAYTAPILARRLDEVREALGLTLDVAWEEVLDALRDTPPAAPEIVTGEQAAELPVGSKVAHCDPETGVPTRRAVVRMMGLAEDTDGMDPTFPYRVLYRAPVPPAPLAVGETVETAAQLDALPVGTTFRDADGHLADRVGPGTWLVYLHEGARYRKPTLPARVLDLGGESR